MGGKVWCWAVLLVVASGHILSLKRRVAEPEKPPENTIMGFFNNRVDHFNLSSRETYSQRYWHIDDYWDPDAGPAILYIQGEGPGSIVGARTMPMELAQEFKGRLYSLEHRFYGISQPCEDWSLACLRLLTHDQALADIANFIETKTQEMGDPNRKWILVGGSYAGAVVAWFKIKYPHLAFITYSSSGVVNSIVNYDQYMHQVYLDMQKDPPCYQIVVSLNDLVTGIIKGNDTALKAKLKATMEATQLGDLDFIMYFTDIYVGEVQYSNRTGVCKRIVKLGEEVDIWKRLELYGVLGRSVGASPADYLLEKEKDIHIDHKSSGRQWMYQVCTAFGYFQTGGRNNPLRDRMIDVEYFHSLCERIFGVRAQLRQEYTNAMTGGLAMVPMLDKTILVNGGDDPWQWAGFRDETFTSDDMLVMRIKCDDCAHCIDLYKPSPTDSSILVQARKTIKETIAGWLATDVSVSVSVSKSRSRRPRKSQ